MLGNMLVPIENRTVGHLALTSFRNKIEKINNKLKKVYNKMNKMNKVHKKNKKIIRGGCSVNTDYVKVPITIFLKFI